MSVNVTSNWLRAYDLVVEAADTVFIEAVAAAQRERTATIATAKRLRDDAISAEFIALSDVASRREDEDLAREEER